MIVLRPSINIDKRGKITTGIKVKNEKGVEYPKATDYFVVDDFPELITAYGLKPKKLVLFFPSNEIEHFFSVDMVLYGSNNQIIRKCNGENECIHRMDETLDVVENIDGNGKIVKKKFTMQDSECCCKLMPQTVWDEKKKKEVKNPKLCNVAMYLKAYVADCKKGKVDNPLCYHFYSGSRNTAANLYSELIKIRNLLNGNLIGIPFGLGVDMVPGKENAKIKFPIWNLQVIGTVTQLRQAMDSYLLDYKKILALPETTEAETTGEETDDETGDQEELFPDNINYWIKQLKDLHTEGEVDAWAEAHEAEFETLGGDRLDVEAAIGDRKAELRK